MNGDIFTSEYMETEFAEALADCEITALKLLIITLLVAAGNALHSNFCAGDEPKWKDPSQRADLLKLSEACETAHAGLKSPKKKRDAAEREIA